MGMEAFLKSPLLTRSRAAAQEAKAEIKAKPKTEKKGTRANPVARQNTGRVTKPVSTKGTKKGPPEKVAQAIKQQANADAKAKAKADEKKQQAAAKRQRKGRRTRSAPQDEDEGEERGRGKKRKVADKVNPPKTDQQAKQRQERAKLELARRSKLLTKAAALKEKGITKEMVEDTRIKEQNEGLLAAQPSIGARNATLPTGTPQCPASRVPRPVRQQLQETVSHDEGSWYADASAQTEEQPGRSYVDASSQTEEQPGRSYADASTQMGEQQVQETASSDKGQQLPIPPSRKDDKKVETKVKSDLIPCGLVNIGNSCYANAAVQLLLAAFGPEEVLNIRGDDNLDNDSLQAEKLKRFNVKSVQLEKTVKNIRGHPEFRGDVKRLASTDLRISSYFGQVLQRLLIPDDGSQRSTTQILFLHLLADRKSGWGEEWYGLIQQDSVEFVDAILDFLTEEHVLDTSKFETIIEVHRTCAECGGLFERGTERHRTLQITADHTPRTLQDMIDSAIDRHESASHLACERCKKLGSISEHCHTSLPDNLLVSVNRNQGSLHTAVLNPWDKELSFRSRTYEVSAMIKRQGNGVESGHFRAIRRHEWLLYTLNDEEVESTVLSSQLNDGRANGMTHMVLLNASRRG